jgi:hypothetical protein
MYRAADIYVPRRTCDVSDDVARCRVGALRMKSHDDARARTEVRRPSPARHHRTHAGDSSPDEMAKLRDSSFAIERLGRPREYPCSGRSVPSCSPSARLQDALLLAFRRVRRIRATRIMLPSSSTPFIILRTSPGVQRVRTRARSSDQLLAASFVGDRHTSLMLRTSSCESL